MKENIFTTLKKKILNQLNKFLNAKDVKLITKEKFTTHTMDHYSITTTQVEDFYKLQ